MNFQTDCSLAAEGKIIQAHKLILSVASPFFMDLFNSYSGYNGIFIIPGISNLELRMVLCYIYTGYVNINPSHVDRFISILTFLGVDIKSQQDLQDDPMDGSFTRDDPQLSSKRGSPKYKRKSCGHRRSCCKARRKLIF